MLLLYMFKIFKKLGFERKVSNVQAIKESLDKAKETCKRLADTELKYLNIKKYKYTADEAMRELGVTSELIHQLAEDYVIQILKTEAQFLAYIKELKSDKKENKELNYTKLRELVHKNLGVARNLRIKDAEKILQEMMVKEDLDYLTICFEALRAHAIILKPTCAYNTIKLIELKSSL
ncbi:MAG: hypothetical protein AUK54_06470 [Helicobacteraceae bacterium CG2_30_36_10]|nr:MAG: hypothetical protein AUK54_06470 [Helicobacteraceae bacterium CG2_30_36_10]